MDIGGALGKKYGPLPGSVWLLLIFIVVFFLIKSRQSKAKTNGTTQGGDTSYISGQGNKLSYTTSSTTTGYYGPGAGGQFTGSYNAPVTENSNNVTKGPVSVVDMPRHYPRLDTPHRHQTWTRPDGHQGWNDGDGHNGRGNQDNHNDHGHQQDNNRGRNDRNGR